MKKLSALIGYLLAFLFLFSPVMVNASRIEMQPNTPDVDDFMVGPGSTEINVKPGDIATQTIQVTNRTGEFKSYTIEIEDFQGSETDPTSGAGLLGATAGRYGAKDWLTPEFMKFSLNHGERLFFDVTVKVPLSADAGDHYAAVLISQDLNQADIDKAKTGGGQNVIVKSRSGSLLYVKVAGNIVEDGKLESFTTDKSKYDKAPINFGLTFRNNGNVRLQPSGRIEIKNSRGKKVDIIKIESYGVLRNSVKLSNYQWNKKLLFGKYTATVTLDRGYGEKQDTMTTEFTVMPWQDIIIVISILFALLISVILVRKQKQGKKRKR